MNFVWIYLISFVSCQSTYNSQRAKVHLKPNGISDGHRLITRALWRIFDALMEKKNHEELYGRVKVVEGALNNMLTTDTKIDSEFNGIKNSLDSFKDELFAMKNDFEIIKEMESRIRNLEEWQLRVGGQKDDGRASFIGKSPEAVYTSCPTPFDQVGGECFHVVINNKKNWVDAGMECAFLGGDLASPSDMANFRNYLRTLSKDRRPKYAWIGGARTGKDVWIWASGNMPGRPMDMSEYIWNVDLPNGIGDCVGVFELSGYRAYDYKCEEEDNFICQYFF